MPTGISHIMEELDKMLTKKEIKEIAGKYADVNKSQYYSLKLISINPSAFLDGYWDACYKVFNDFGNEIEGPLLIAISGETGQIYSMEELIMNNSENQNVKISNEPVNSKSRYNFSLCQEKTLDKVERTTLNFKASACSVGAFCDNFVTN